MKDSKIFNLNGDKTALDCDELLKHPNTLPNTNKEKFLTNIYSSINHFGLHNFDFGIIIPPKINNIMVLP